ncbi:MAG: hypothetical protein WKG07_04700 [Hymenobacter sp.]
MLGINHYATSERVPRRAPGPVPRPAGPQRRPPPGLRGPARAARGRRGPGGPRSAAAPRPGTATAGRWPSPRRTWAAPARSRCAGCTSCWQAADRLRASGVDLRALTVWSLLGAFDWDNLLTQDGAIVRARRVRRARRPAPAHGPLPAGAQPHPARGNYAHPVLAGPGWWQRDIRYQWLAEAA